MDYKYHDDFKLEYDRVAAAKLRADPSLFAIVEDNMRRWRARIESGGTMEEYYFHRWQALVERGMEACISMALEETEDAAAMRQTAPFEGLLTQEERRATAERVRARHEHGRVRGHA